MSDNEAPKTAIKPWRCKNGHVLGAVERNGSGIRQLWFYRQAIDPQAEEQAEVEVMGTAEGLVMNLVCSICGGERTWVPGEEALRRLLKRYGVREE